MFSTVLDGVRHQVCEVLEIEVWHDLRNDGFRERSDEEGRTTKLGLVVGDTPVKNTHTSH